MGGMPETPDASRLAAALLGAVDAASGDVSTPAAQDLYAAGGAVGYGPFAAALPDMVPTEFGGGYGIVQGVLAGVPLLDGSADHLSNLTASEVSGVMRRAGMAGAHVSYADAVLGTAGDVDPVTGLSVADVSVGDGHD